MPALAAALDPADAAALAGRFAEGRPVIPLWPQPWSRPRPSPRPPRPPRPEPDPRDRWLPAETPAALVARLRRERIVPTALRVPCAEHDAEIGEPCWQMPQGHGRGVVVAVCGPRLALCYAAAARAGEVTP